jgi:amidase
VLLAGEVKPTSERPTIHLLDDAFALADAEVREALAPGVEQLRALYGERVRTITLAEIFGDGHGSRWETWLDTYCVVQWSEVRSSLGAWIAAERPEFGPATAKSFKLVYDLDRTRVRAAIEMREALYRDLRRALGPGDLVCLPTVPSSAPAKSSNAQDRTSGYYRKALSLTALAGIGRRPQVSMPLGATGTSPVGLSLVGAQGEDLLVVRVAEAIGKAAKS